MVSSFKNTKFYFENLFATLWTSTPIHYAGQDFSGKGLNQWVNPSFNPRSVVNSGFNNETGVTYGVLYVACWADTDVEAMNLADEVITFINSNIDKTYRVQTVEIDDHEWGDSNKVYIIVSFQLKSYTGAC